MGVGSSFFTLYTRILSTDKYNEQTIFHIEQNNHFSTPEAIGCFKHELFALTMGKIEDTKAIYLYENKWRIAKGLRVSENEYEVIFRTPVYQKMWFETEERLAPTRWPLLERSFDKLYQTNEKNDTTLHILKNIMV